VATHDASRYRHPACAIAGAGFQRGSFNTPGEDATASSPGCQPRYTVSPPQTLPFPEDFLEIAV
jgi:hypothetical protein